MFSQLKRDFPLKENVSSEIYEVLILTSDLVLLFSYSIFQKEESHHFSLLIWRIGKIFEISEACMKEKSRLNFWWGGTIWEIYSEYFYLSLRLSWDAGAQFVKTIFQLFFEGMPNVNSKQRQEAPSYFDLILWHHHKSNSD